MSPWSFLSDLVSPVIGSLNSYLPVFGLPEGVQHKLVGFILRRTLGRFVKHDGLLARQVDEGISSGSISFGRLELDAKVSDPGSSRMTPTPLTNCRAGDRGFDTAQSAPRIRFRPC
jgi:hypothetical protein